MERAIEIVTESTINGILDLYVFAKHVKSANVRGKNMNVEICESSKSDVHVDDIVKREKNTSITF